MNTKDYTDCPNNKEIEIEDDHAFDCGPRLRQIDKKTVEYCEEHFMLCDEVYPCQIKLEDKEI